MKKTKKEIMENVEFTKSKIIGNNTVEYFNKDGERVIRLHQTDIVKFKPNGSIVLNTGGWKTPTTKSRINEYSPYKIYQDNSIWYLTVNGVNYVFEDGMSIDVNGNVNGEGSDPKQYLKIKKDIKKYVKGFIQALQNKQIEKPGNGDCWYCRLKDIATGDTLGEVTKDKDHILNHFKEKYYVPSLLMNAIREIPISIVAQNQLGYWFGYHNQDCSFGDIAQRQIESSLTRYLKRQLGLAR